MVCGSIFAVLISSAPHTRRSLPPTLDFMALTVYSDLGSSTSHNLTGDLLFFFFCISLIVCNVSFIVSVALCALFCFNVVCYSVIYVFFVLHITVVTLPAGKPFAVITIIIIIIIIIIVVKVK
jgi:hypothetical protein